MVAVYLVVWVLSLAIAYLIIRAAVADGIRELVEEARAQREHVYAQTKLLERALRHFGVPEVSAPVAKPA